MIFTLGISVLVTFVGWVIAGLNTALPSVASVTSSSMASSFAAIYGYAHSLDFFLPFNTTVLPALLIVIVVDGGLLLYMVAKWAWSKIPGVN
jgi:hypothetical protein